MRVCLLMLIVGAESLQLIASAATSSGSMPAPPFPYAAYQNHQEGCVIVQVTFGNNGQATDCSVLRSSGVQVLDRSTVGFIIGHWKSGELAGRTVRLPITYALPGSEPGPHSLGEINHLPPGSPARTVVLQVTFAADGGVLDVLISRSSGIKQLDADTMAYVWLHWRSLPYAGQSKLVPIVFKPAATAKPASSS